MIFRVGMKAVFIGQDIRPEAREFVLSGALVKGGVYTIREIYTDPYYHTTGLRLAEVICSVHPIHRIEFGFCADKFRPVVDTRTDISVFQSICDRVTRRQALPVE